MSERDLTPDRVATLRGAALRFGLYCSLLLPLGFGLVFLRQLLEFRDPFVPWTEDAALLLRGTDWGRMYLLGAFLALVTPLTFAIGRWRTGPGWILASLSVLALGAFPALTGHANSGAGWGRMMTLSADALHVWAAGAWIGGLAGILFLDWTLRGRDDGGVGALPSLVPAFSPIAVGGVVTLVVTGILASWIHLPDLRSLIDGAYGRTLLIKLAAVGGVLALGWLNWRRHTPRLGRTSGPGALRRAATVELVIAQLVLLATAVLVRTPPSG